MTQHRDIPARLSAVEVRVEEVAVDAANALHLAQAHDRDIADLGVKVDANRRAINALGVQTAARFDQVDARFDALEGEMNAKFEQVDRNFAEMRARFDQTAAGLERIVALLTDRDS